MSTTEPKDILTEGAEALRRAAREPKKQTDIAMARAREALKPAAEAAAAQLKELGAFMVDYGQKLNDLIALDWYRLQRMQMDGKGGERRVDRLKRLVEDTRSLLTSAQAELGAIPQRIADLTAEDLQPAIFPDRYLPGGLYPKGPRNIEISVYLHRNTADVLRERVREIEGALTILLARLEQAGLRVPEVVTVHPPADVPPGHAVAREPKTGDLTAVPTKAETAFDIFEDGR